MFKARCDEPRQGISLLKEGDLVSKRMMGCIFPLNPQKEPIPYDAQRNALGPALDPIFYTNFCNLSFLKKIQKP